MDKKDIYFAEEELQMLEAYKKAQHTFKYFWRELWWERRRIVPALDLACVKVKFQQKQLLKAPIIEHMWIQDIDFDGITVKGFLLNKPNELTNIKEGAFVEIPVCEITDWLFAINKKTYGGYTIQVLRAQMTEKEREAHDEAWGLDFGDYNKIQIVYEEDKNIENLIEHPMSKDMADSLKEFLSKNPKELTHKDEFGYTMLHREAIAGNNTCVEILLQMGADISGKTNSGYTALDFVKKMEWEHILPIL